MTSGGALFLCGLVSAAGLAQTEDGSRALPLANSETYWLRVENTPLGRVELSADGGGRYYLVGRVLRPATGLARDRSVTMPGIVLRANETAIVFSAATGGTLKLCAASSGPRGSAPPADPAAIVTNLDAGKGLFGNLRPPYRAAVRLRVGESSLTPLPEGYSPSEEDVFVFLVTLPPPPAPAVTPDAPALSEAQRQADWQAVVRRRVEALGKAYIEGAAARARAQRRRVVSGIVTLKAKLPSGEPDPITSVTYHIDGHMVALQNVAPFAYAWDTRQVPDGEYAIEIRALNAQGVLVTRAHTLIAVQNGKPSANSKSP